MTQQDAVNRWVESSQSDWQTAEILFKSQKYAYALFFTHLALEKMFKAYIVKITDDAPPITHDLKKLAELVKFPLDDKKRAQLDTITDFNVQARYDIYKKQLYFKATEDYTDKYMKVAGGFILWLKKRL